MNASVIQLRRQVPVASVQGALALDLTPRLDPPEPPHSAGVATRRGDLVASLPPRRLAIERFVHAYLVRAAEIASGDRPSTQLLRQSSPRVYADLNRRAQLVTAAAGSSPGSGRGRGAVRPVVCSIRTSLVTHHALEAAAHLRYGARSRALAGRFEVIEGRWQCVALEWA